MYRQELSFAVDILKLLVSTDSGACCSGVDANWGDGDVVGGGGLVLTPGALALLLVPGFKATAAALCLECLKYSAPPIINIVPKTIAYIEKMYLRLLWTEFTGDTVTEAVRAPISRAATPTTAEMKAKRSACVQFSNQLSMRINLLLFICISYNYCNDIYGSHAADY